MTLPGGPADKLGNRYEKWWTLSEFVRMLRGEAESIRIEDPVVDKAEFVVDTGAHRELYQVKRSHPNGKWSLAALRSDGLLKDIGRQLRDNDDRFVFASGSDARELADLCEAARDAESAEQFECAFLAAGNRRAHFKALCECWMCDAPTAIERLQRVEVRTINERELEDKVRWSMPALFPKDSNQVVEALRGIAEDAVHRTITRQELVDDLGGRGYPLRSVVHPASAGIAVRKATDRYLDAARRRLIRQRLVSRDAAKALLARLAETATDSVLTGRAGSGKTACIVEVADALRAQGVPVLAFRLDRLVSASTTAELGRRLELEESPALVLAAAADAASRTGVLIVDQLDAVSTMSGRTSGAFDLVEQLLLEARGVRPRTALQTVVVCREFDWENDARLRRLMPSDADARNAKVAVTDFPVEEVKTILTAADFDPTAFGDRQLKILQLPQNLSLFLEAGFDPPSAPAFATSIEIFDWYWKVKQKLVADRVAPASDQWMWVIETLCDEMARTQQLSVRREVLDRIPAEYVDQLASEGVIAFDGRRYGFGHESFFDYAFARVFVRRSETVAAFLKASEQHLFRRAQVRQVLAYLRDADRPRYVKELRDLLADDGIRPHLKDLAFALLAEVPDPTEEEWRIWRSSIGPALKAIKDGVPNPDKLSALAWRRLFGSRSWFAEVDRRGLIEDWLTSENDRLADMAMNYLRVHQRHSPDRVAELLEPYADLGGDWALRLRSLMERAQYHTSRCFFDLFLRLLDNGVLDEARDRFADNGTFWSMLYSLGENRPEWVAEVLARRLRRRLSLVRATGKKPEFDAFLDRDEFAVDPISKSAENAPAAFAEHVLPVVLEISDAAVTDDTPPKHDSVWPGLWKFEHLSAEDACLLGLARALAVLARDGDPALDGMIPALRSRKTHVANHLLMALYGAGAERLAYEAVKLLCDEPWRFQDALFHYDDGCATAVIRAATPHCAIRSRERLEEVILDYVSPDERSADGYRQHERTRLDALSAFPEKLRSGRAKRHLAELTRKFDEPTAEPKGITAGWVTSPIVKDDAAKMTDDQWLRTIEKYSSKHRSDFSNDGPTGGAWQLAGVLEARVKEEPERFARLSLRFPADANPTYLMWTLDALKDAAIPTELKLRVCHKAFDDARDPCGGSIADVIGSVEDTLPDDAIRMLDWLATEDGDPAMATRQKDAGGGQTHNGGEILTAGINTTRGRAAWAVRDLVLKDAAYVERFRGTLDRMVRDPSVAVRSCVAGTLRAVAFRDRALGLSLFLNMDMSEDRLLATPDVDRFIHENLRNSLAELRPFVERMLRSSKQELRQAGGRLACIGALHHDGAADLANEALNGDAHSRRGAAQVAAANIAHAEHRGWCQAALVRLFNDEDVEVQREAASCFRHMPDEALDRYEDLISTFCSSRAFETASFSLLRALDHSRGRLPETTCKVCEKFFESIASDSHAGRAEHIVPKLVFRTYQQHPDDEWTVRSLDLIDRLCLEGIFGAQDELERFER